MISVLTARGGDYIERHRVEVHMKMEVEIGVMHPQARNARRSETGGGKEQFFCKALERTWPFQHLDLASRAVREYVSVFNHPVYSILS